jgi:hypothetical protein
VPDQLQPRFRAPVGQRLGRAGHDRDVGGRERAAGRVPVRAADLPRRPGSATYDRPGIAYIALRQILGHANFVRALTQIQRRYGDGAITEAQLEAGFRQWLPVNSAACGSRLGEFFRQWFDTAYPPGGGASRPAITGPGLAGPGFCTGGCTR